MLDWIMTIPGILISCGVVLLILAVILFILGNKKGKVKTDNTEIQRITREYYEKLYN